MVRPRENTPRIRSNQGTGNFTVTLLPDVKKAGILRARPTAKGCSDAVIPYLEVQYGG